MSYREFYTRHLPHWQPLYATLFVTFRLAGSLPQAVVERLRDEREAELQKAARIVDVAQRSSQEYFDERRAFARWESALDFSVEGPHWLAKPEIAEIVAEALYHRDAKLYDLLAFCIMPNHVHVVCTPLPVARTASPLFVGRTVSPADDAAVGRTDSPTYNVHSLATILQSLKGYTARRANAGLRRHGPFWQEESYDHVVRDGEELERVIRYVVNNPVKARLVESWRDWPWTYCKPDCTPD